MEVCFLRNERNGAKSCNFSVGLRFLSGRMSVCARPSNADDKRGGGYVPVTPLSTSSCVDGNPALFCGERVAVAANKIVRGKDVRLLLCHELANG